MTKVLDTHQSLSGAWQAPALDYLFPARNRVNQIESGEMKQSPNESDETILNKI